MSAAQTDPIPVRALNQVSGITVCCYPRLTAVAELKRATGQLANWRRLRCGAAAHPTLADSEPPSPLSSCNFFAMGESFIVPKEPS